MKQNLREFTQSIDQANIGTNELFNMDMVVAKHSLFIYTLTPTKKQLSVIMEHLKSGVKVILLTSKRMDEKEKEMIVDNFFTDEESSVNYQLFIIIGSVILLIGAIMLAISLGYHFMGSEINRENEVLRLILPLLEMYLGFVVADYAYKKKYMLKPLHENLKLGVFKSARQLPKGTIYLTDNKRIIYQNIDDDTLGISHVKIIENPAAVEQLVTIIEKKLPLIKREGLSLSDLRVWLLE